MGVKTSKSTAAPAFKAISMAVPLAAIIMGVLFIPDHQHFQKHLSDSG
jgi:hypothetical protein